LRKHGKKTIRLDEATLTLVGRLLREHVRPHVPRIACALVCMAIVAGSTAAFTQLIKPIVNDIFLAKRADMLLPIALAALVVFLAKGLATYGQAVLMGIVGHRIVSDMQLQLFKRLMGADLVFYHENSPGQLVARFINDINMLRTAVSNTLTGFGKDTLTALALVAVMFHEDWVLTLTALFAFPLAVVPIVRLGKRMRRVSGNTQARVGRLTTLLDEAFQGARHVKAYGMERYEADRAGTAIDEVFHLNMKAARTRSALHPIMEFLGGLAIVAVILYGGHQVVSGEKDAGSFFAFITALLLAYEPVKRLAKLNTDLQEGLAAAHRVFSVMDREPTIRDKPGARELAVAGGAIRFERVSFSYGRSKQALHDVTFEAPAGKTTALVGPSGAGKSTILNLIPRFYDVGTGRVAIDGEDVRDVTILRRNIALVSQEILLFDDTVGANIAYGKPDAGDGEIAAAAHHAGAHDFIAELPQGYDTMVGPRGVKLSGGQRQRIAIARAMLKNAPVLLLDEATSSLDTHSERQVQQALDTLTAGRTTLAGWSSAAATPPCSPAAAPMPGSTPCSSPRKPGTMRSRWRSGRKPEPWQS
jgi:subfamily B ATP-binding cassette protein MsbA